MGIVRTTFERCRKVRKILETLMVKFEERDVFMNRGFQQEVRERLGLTRVIVPQVFVEGRHLGGAEVVEQLNEIGHLRELVRPYKKQSVGGICQQCGGYRYLLCPVCGGSKKSVTHRHHFSEDLVALRCVTCDESGLIRCQACITGEV
ncbi:glutaredoxin domain-containing cysteine-rich protein CG12206 [Caerostris extrusa]|nr:glutaredoxin domain-containing cysteine-rich protein CG12206 [Caerostris extrusa]